MSDTKLPDQWPVMIREAHLYPGWLFEKAIRGNRPSKI